MEKLYEKDIGGSTYRSQDNIQNFKVKVQLDRLSSTAIGFVTSADSTEAMTMINENNELIRQGSTNEIGQSYLENEVLTIQWQKKYFSEKEFDFYSLESNCSTAEDYKYHAQLEKIKRMGGRSNNRIFTYLDNDRFSEDFDMLSAVTTNANEIPTEISLKLNELRRRNTGATMGGNLWKNNSNEGATDLQVVIEKPSDDFKMNNHLINTPIQRMTIMADITPPGEPSSALYEKRLCTITFDSNSVLRITPDITKSNLPYKIDSMLSRDIWQYRLLDDSAKPSAIERRKEIKSLQQAYEKSKSTIESVIGVDFENVQENCLRVVTFGEIVSVQSFEYDDLHVEYLWDIPAMWRTDEKFSPFGCTHSCKTTLCGEVERAYFSHPLNCDLLTTEYYNNDDDYGLQWPRLYMHIISYDGWGRRRTEGYGSLLFPLFPGPSIRTVQCWRPIGGGGYSSRQMELRRFFIGGSPELENPTFTTVPSEFEGNKLSKHGIQCESTGSVTIRWNMLIQHEPSVHDETATHVRKKKMQTALKLAQGKLNQESVVGVMDAFLRARKRMQLAREAVPDHIKSGAERRSRNAYGDNWQKVITGREVLKPKENKDKDE